MPVYEYRCKKCKKRVHGDHVHLREREQEGDLSILQEGECRTAHNPFHDQDLPKKLTLPKTPSQRSRGVKARC